jgi:hypothetical protein
MPDMNPYNFVRLQPMAEDARQVPLGHKQLVREHNGEQVRSGRLQGLLTAFGPLLVLSHDLAAGDLVVESDGHKRFKRFFHYPGDQRPVIPASSLKGMVRAVAEAACNGCLSILNETYVKRWDDFASAYPPGLHFCGGLPTGGAFCPTCRIFGSAPEGEESGTAERGATPQAFQGKVRFGDAIFQGDLAGIYQPPVTLVTLSMPKLSNRVWYSDPARGSSRYPLAGRKFYFHHDDLTPQADNSPAHRNQRSTVTPLKPGATFAFQLDFRNLLESELSLLLYALELEPASALVQVNGRSVSFDWQNVHQHKGVYPKLGYGKPAGLGSVCILVTELDLLDPTARYGGQVDGWQRLTGAEMRQVVEALKRRFRRAQVYTRDGKTYYHPYLADLRQILRFPNDVASFRYPTLREFQSYRTQGKKLPMPGRE